MQEFVRMFEACELTQRQFSSSGSHPAGLDIPAALLESWKPGSTSLGAIRKFAAHHGKSDKYHETLTVAWLRLVGSAMARVPLDASFEDLTIAAPELLDKRTIEKFYSSAVLESEEARTSWVEPDLQPLP